MEPPSIEYRIIEAGRHEKSAMQELNEAAAEGWRYVDTMKAERWGSESAFVAVVLMERNR